mmetsp:Transcript_1123/g.3057  ORF Transcript_1123/g.3057 Transcript_1123/m.3057 type:complete len:339 (-) Transcript_1123:1545-2561(-)
MVVLLYGLHGGEPPDRAVLLQDHVADRTEPAHELRVLLRELGAKTRDFPGAPPGHLEHLVVARDAVRLRLFAPQGEGDALSLQVSVVALTLLVRQSQVLHFIPKDGQLLVIRPGLEHGVGVAEAGSLRFSLGEPAPVHHRLLEQALEPRDDALLHLDRRAALTDPRSLALALLQVLAQLRVRLLQLEVPTLELLRLHRLLVHGFESVHELGVASLLLRVPRRELAEPILRLHQVVDAVQAERLQPRSRVRVSLLVQQPPELPVVTLQALPGSLSLLVSKLEVLNPALRGLEPGERVVESRLLVNHIRRHGAQHPRALAVAADAEPAAGIKPALNLLLP